jgi:hypothetical protein
VGLFLTLKIVATDASGARLPNVVITITSPPLSTIVPASGTTLTDASGVAQVTVIGSTPGAGELLASATIDGETRASSTPLMVIPAGGSAQPGLALSLLDTSAADVTLSPSVAVGSQLTLMIVATHLNGAPAANVVVTITEPAVATILPVSGTVLTDSAGVARVAVTGSIAGAGELTASATIDGQPTTKSTPLMVAPVFAADKSGLKLSLFDANAVDVSQSPRVALGSQLNLKVVATDLNGLVVPNALITVTAPSVASLLPAVGTVLTDNLGVAEILVEGLAEGAGALIVAGTIDATAKTASIPMVVIPRSPVSQSPTALLLAFMEAVPTTLKIAAAVQQSTSTLTFKVVNQAGQAVPNQQVTFTPSVTTGGLSVFLLSQPRKPMEPLELA